MLICPHCEQALTRDGQVYRCPQGHTFDVARQGYVNLLRRPTKLPSDTKEMLAARRRFLARGYYEPLAEAIASTMSDWLRIRSAPADQTAGGVLDAGCGEGYFTRAVARALADVGWAPSEANDTPSVELTRTVLPVTGGAFSPHIYSIDLARDAVSMAARYARSAPDADAPVERTVERQMMWLVANIKERLPFADASIGAIMNVFAPHNAVEFARILAPGGLLLLVIPTPTHLLTARAPLQLLDIEPNKRLRLLTQLEDDFVLAHEQSLTYSMALDAAAQSDLRMMAPHKATQREGADAHTAQPALETPTTLITDAAFSLLAFVRKAL